ncbi:MAG: hypothetical protein U0169_04745 [Polyangiaceae bacterium]
MIPRTIVRTVVGTALSGGALVACAQAEPTAVLVKVSAQVRVRHVLVSIDNSDGTLAHCQDFDVLDPRVPSTSKASGAEGPFALPVTLALVPAGTHEEASFRVRVDGYLAGGDGTTCASSTRRVPDVRAEAVSRYVEGAVVELPMPLTLSCLFAECDAGTTCRFGRCVDPRISPDGLERVAAGRADGTPCVSIDTCERVALGAPSGPDCAYDLSAVPNAASLVPYVVYALPGSTDRYVEFLDASEFDVAGEGASRNLRLPPGLCNFVRTGVVTDVGLGAPCPAIRNRAICAESYSAASAGVLGETSRPVSDAGAGDATVGDATLGDATIGETGAETSVDAGADASVGDGGRDGEGGSSTDDASVDATSDAPSSEGGAGDGGDGGTTDGGSSPCGPTCCGVCTSGPSFVCLEEVGNLDRTLADARNGMALSGDGAHLVFLSNHPSGLPAVFTLHTGENSLTELGSAGGARPMALTTTTQFAAVGTVLSLNPTSDMTIQIEPLPGVPRPQVQFFEAPGKGHASLLASDGQYVFALYRDPNSSVQPPWVVQRIEPSNANAMTTITKSLDGLRSSTIGSPLEMTAVRNAALVAFRDVGGAETLVYFDFGSNLAPAIASLAAGLELTGLAPFPNFGGEPDFAFVRTDAVSFEVARWVPGADMEPGAPSSYASPARGLAFVDHAGGGPRYAFLGFSSTPSLFRSTAILVDSFASPEPSASNLRASSRCAYWIGDSAGLDPRIRTKRIPAPP